MSDKRAVAALPAWLLPLISWAASLYCGVDLIHSVGFLPSESALTGHALMLLLFLLFLLLPFFGKIKIGDFLELEREVKKAKDELQEFKADVRHNLSLLSTNVSTISGFSNQLTVNLPNASELREARQEVESNAPRGLAREDKADDPEQFLPLEDPTLALAWVRIEMERVLRKILGRRLSIANEKSPNIKFTGITRLFELFLDIYPRYEYLRDGFRFVSRVCNAAVHAQRLSEDQVSEAMGLGATIISILGTIAEPSVTDNEGAGGDAINS